jgi:hypothetical protein
MQATKHPILGELQDRIQSCSFYARRGDSAICAELMEEALELVQEAIAQIQGAREDAARMSGRVTLDTELLDMLAPDELTFPQLLALHPTLERAFYRLELLDANGASATASDIQDTVVYGHLSAPDAERFADEINAACDKLERGEE